MSIRSRIEKLEQLFGVDFDGGPPDTTLTWAPHEPPPEFLPAESSPATAELLNVLAEMDASVPAYP